MNPRAVAASILTRMEHDREDTLRAVDLLDAALQKHAGADPRDRGLLTEMVYGVLRWQLRLDHSLRPMVRQKFSKLEPVARALLRIGAYQLLFLDRVPDRAAVHATQEAASLLRADRVKGLLNAVLRRLAQDGERLPEGLKDAAIAVRTGLPTWILKELRYLSTSPDDLEQLAAGLRRRPELTLRPTLTRGGAEAARTALQAEGFAVSDGACGTLVASGGGDPFGGAAAAGGLFVAQDPASLAVVDLCGPLEGKRVLDLCAGRGIKATALADRGAHVLAVDVVAAKLESARKLAAHLGLSDRIRTQVADPTRDALATEAPFDVVLIDAPCTGLGTLARRPEIAWRRSSADIKRLAGLQSRLVEAGARHVAPGGRLVYAVCTFTRAESAVAVPSGFETNDTHAHRWRPDAGFDAFFARRMRRASP